jgi:hypothetical protein
VATLAWGSRVSPLFRQKVAHFSPRIGLDPSIPMAVMAFESGLTFRADVRNGAGSGAVGLLQFMPVIAASLGTSTASLAAMSAEQQLDFVAAFFLQPYYRGRLKTLEDAYMAVLWPGAIGKPVEAVLFDKADPAHPKLYVQNAGLDFNHDGKITKGEAAARVVAMLAEGMKPGNVYEGAL